VEKEIFSVGINPFYQSEAEITDEIQEISTQMNGVKISAVYFYGAGCLPEKKAMVAAALTQIFHNADIEVNTDLLAAARALFGANAGIACILGTGSNSCFYDGERIAKNVSPLGFILGDEGSGAVLGKKLIGNLLKNQLPKELCERFFERYQTTSAQIMEAVYKRPFPNRYLAQFTQFLYEYKQEKPIFELIYSSFSDFFRRNVQQYDYANYEVSLVGSVAFYLEEILRKAATDNQISIGKIIKSPMEGLIKFHS
jgi:N-acetylglucosamine kinase-like BadF-type ATPase